jgi:DNA-binding CsgD family transcriptional regulator
VARDDANPEDHVIADPSARDDDSQRTLFAAAIDTLGAGAALFDAYGRVMIANRPMAMLLESPSHRMEIERFVGKLRVAAESRIITGELRHGARLYQLRGRRVNGSTFCITLHEASLPGVLSEEELRSRFHLTRQESRVALRLAEGMSNEDVACAFGVSPHTARRHTERVLFKMRLTSRAEVAWSLLQR